MTNDQARMTDAAGVGWTFRVDLEGDEAAGTAVAAQVGANRLTAGSAPLDGAEQ